MSHIPSLSFCTLSMLWAEIPVIHKMSLKFTQVIAVLLALVPGLYAQWDASRFAWYSSDAGSDFASALPIGNGRLGAAIFGTGDERITLNENSIWSGPWQDRANRNSKNALSGIRSQLMNGDISSAGQAVLQNSECLEENGCWDKI